MKLNELLKVNSVRCIKTKVDEDLVEGEIYKVEGFNDETIKIVDSNGFSSWYNLITTKFIYTKQQRGENV